MSNQINEAWVEEQYQQSLDRLAGTDDETILKIDTPDPDSYKDNLEDR